MTSFERPTKDDFVRILMEISEDARALAEAKTIEIQSRFGATGGAGHSHYPIMLAAELQPIHKVCVNRAMEFIPQFAAQSQLSLSELCEAARELLMRRVVVFSTPVLKAMRTPSDAAHQGTVARERKPFEAQIDEAIKNLKVGFVSDRSVAMDPADTIQAKALKILKAIYEETRSREEPVFVEELGGHLGIYIDDVRAAWRYLKEKGLIETFSIPYTARIAARGIDAIEAAQLHPDKPTPVFPGVTYNVTVHGTGAGTQMNFGTTGSTQIAQVTGTDADLLEQLMTGTRQLLGQLQQTLPASSLSPSVKEQVVAALTELHTATDAAKPEVSRLRRGLESLGRILETAAGDLVAVGARMAIQSLLGIPLP